MTIRQIDATQNWNLRWIPRLSGAIAIIENTPCPPSCSSWDEEADGCDCGKGRALTWLWATVGADEEHGRVPEGHPLQFSRLAWDETTPGDALASVRARSET